MKTRVVSSFHSVFPFIAGSKTNNPETDLSALAANSGVNLISIAEFAGIMPEVYPEIYSLNPLSRGIFTGAASSVRLLNGRKDLLFFEIQDVNRRRTKRIEMSFANFINVIFGFTVSQIRETNIQIKH